jgi:ABC-type polysaccharide/polyol phosphate export permease
MFFKTTNISSWGIITPLSTPRVFCYLAWLEIKNQYRRTILGPFWILGTLIIFSAAMAYVYSSLFDLEFNKYVTYVSTGMIGWNWGSAILTTSCTVYITNSNLITEYPTDKSYLLWTHVIVQLLVFLHQLPLVFLFYLSGMLSFNYNILFIIPSIFIIIAINIGIASILSVVVVRFRDIERILTSLTVIIMVTTPIFWMPSMVGKRALIYKLNPFHYIVELIRDPLMGNTFKPENYIIGSLLAVTALIVGGIFHKKYSQYIVFRL